MLRLTRGLGMQGVAWGMRGVRHAGVMHAGVRHAGVRHAGVLHASCLHASTVAGAGWRAGRAASHSPHLGAGVQAMASVPGEAERGEGEGAKEGATEEVGKENTAKEEVGKEEAGKEEVGKEEDAEREREEAIAEQAAAAAAGQGPGPVGEMPAQHAEVPADYDPDYELFYANVQADEVDAATDILASMEEQGKRISERQWVQLLSKCVSAGDFPRAMELLDRLCSMPQGPSPAVFNILLNGCMRNNRPEHLPELLATLQRFDLHAAELHRQQAKFPPRLRKGMLARPTADIDPDPALKLPPACPPPPSPSSPHALPPASLAVALGSAAERSKEAARARGMQDAFERQIAMEYSKVEQRVAQYHDQVRNVTEMAKGAELGSAKKLILQWFRPFSEAIGREQARLQQMEQEGSVILKPVQLYKTFLQQLPADRLAVIAIHEALSLAIVQPDGIKMGTLAVSIGRCVLDEIHTEELKERFPKLVKKKKYMRSSRSFRKIVQNRLSPYPVSTASLAATGGVLLDLLLASATVEAVDGKRRTPEELLEQQLGGEEQQAAGERVPAFVHAYRYEKGKTFGIIRCSEAVLARLEVFDSIKETMYTKLYPTVYPPQRWTDINQGGYYVARTEVMRTYTPQQTELLRVADLSRVYHVLDILGEVPWRINRAVYDVMHQCWEAGGNFPYVPSRDNMRFPPPPADARTNADARMLWRKDRAKIQQKNKELHSLRCDFILKLLTARQFVDEPRIYFPHNMDFRGRVYPIPPHLNHMGADISRGLLEFAEGRPLGSTGLKWLKVHVANLCGKNKVPFEERVRFADQHLAEILDSADRPLAGNRWWLKSAEDHWQCLAACMEIANAVRSGSPETYVCNLPTHMDGSCNGLQHYAALGGDVEGGRGVNLLPSDTPQDIYSHVLRIVLQTIEKAAGDDDAMAKSLLGKVSRKTIKQTVMTSVYGVTFTGARAQIANAMKDQELVAEEEIFAASQYVAKVTFEAMGEMFQGARQIMDWLGECASTVGKGAGEPMSWRTPLGLPVVQHYRKEGKQVVKTRLQNLVLVDNQEDLPVMVQKQRSAFPPNYVHSLDSTHMFYTAQMCHEAGITFAAVHDSFWTHAGTVDVMSKLLREAFIRLHSRPLLDELRTQLQHKYPQLSFRNHPARGELDIQKLRDSKYFFH